MEHIVIIGAGSAGLLLAHYLQQQRPGDRVSIYEQRPDPSQVDLSSQRSFPISLQTRGLEALRGIPGLIDALSSQGIWSTATYFYNARGKARRITREQATFITDRNQVARTLLAELRDRAGDAVNIQFNCACVAVNPDQQTVTLQPEDGAPFTVTYDRLIAADGARSQVRTQLAEQGKLQCEQELVADAYKSIGVPCRRDATTAALAGDGIHGWQLADGMRAVMAPQPGDWLQGVVVFPPDRDPTVTHTDPAALLSWFQTQCPALAPLLTRADMAALQAQPVARLVTVRCDRLHVGDRIGLIGDAAHAVSASVGQGCNSALQDAQVLAQLLAEQGDWGTALTQLTATRLADVHALRELSDYTFPRTGAMRLEFGLRLMSRSLLPQWLTRWMKPLPMQLIMDSDLPYAEVLNRTDWWIERVRRSVA